MEYLRKTLSLFLCFLMGLTGPAVSRALADGFGQTLQTGTVPSSNEEGAGPCICPNCPDKKDATGASSGNRSFYRNGSESLNETDLSLPGIFPITIQRLYNNQAIFDSPLGYGWDISYNERLRTYEDNSVVIRNATGVKSSFIYTGGSYVSENNPRLQLIQNPDGTFVFYSNPTGIHRHYDHEGKLVRQQDIMGGSLRMQYSTQPEPLVGMSPNSISPGIQQIVSYNHQLLRIEQWDANDTFTGRYVEFSYDGTTGRLTGVSDFAGRSIGYQHDGAGNLIRINYPEGLYKSYQYTDPNDKHNMTISQIGYDANAPVTQVTREYDMDDRMTLETRAGGSIAIDYTIPLQKTKVTQTTVDSEGAALHQLVTIYEFNTEGFLIKTTDEEKALEFVRDSRNNIIEKIAWKNNGSVTYPNLVKEISANYVFDAENNMTSSSITIENGEQIISKYFYDYGVVTEQHMYSSRTPDKIHKVFFEYNRMDGKPTTIASFNILTDNTPVPVYNSVLFKYDTDGRPIAALFENGDEVTLEYSNGLMTKQDGISFSHDNIGRIIGREDRNGHVTQYEYDNVGRVVKVTNPLGQETIYTYTGWELTRVEQGKTAELSGQLVEFLYDEYGRVKQSSIDLDGSPVMQETYSFDSNGNILTAMDQQGRATSFTYDPWGRLLSITDSKGDSSNAVYSFSGKLISVTDPMSNTTSYEYDALGRLIKTTDALGGTTSLVLDEAGQVLELKDAEGRLFTFGYDLAGRTIWQEDPVTGRTLYSYDQRSRANKIQHQNGTINTYQYNKHNQVGQVNLAVGTESSSVLRYGYDNMGNLLWYSDSTMGLDPLFTMTYDSLNRLKSKTLNPISKTMQFDYTAQGQRQKLTVSDDTNELFSYFYSYDGAGRLATLTEQPLNQTTSFSYDVSGFLTGKSYTNGTTTTLGYSSSGMLSDLHHKNSSGTTIDHFQYTRDKLNRIIGVADNQGTTSYSYDELGRLISADYPAASILTDESYTYDLTGNRLTSSTIADWTYSEDGKLLGYDGNTINYDARGRQISETVNGATTAYKYDSLNRLTEVANTNEQAAYSYDYSSRRIKKTVDNNNTWYLYDGAKLLANFGPSGQLTRHYSYRSDDLGLLGITENGNAYSVMNDHSQTPQYVTNSAQSVLWQAKYQAFGEPSINNDVDNNGTAFAVSHRFPGQYSESDTEHSYNWRRSYNSQTGRFTSADPIGLSGGINLFAYGLNDPVNLMDPDGREPITLTIIGVSLVAGSLGFISTYDSKKDNLGEALVVAAVGTVALPIATVIAPTTLAGGFALGAGLGVSGEVVVQGINKPNECWDGVAMLWAGVKGVFATALGPFIKSYGVLAENVGADVIAGGVMDNASATLDFFYPEIERTQDQLSAVQRNLFYYERLHAPQLLKDGLITPDEIKADRRRIKDAIIQLQTRIKELKQQQESERLRIKKIRERGYSMPTFILDEV